MSDIWNQRYAQKEYVYGTEPNKYFKQELSNLKPGKILFPAEGEGRNAVYAAMQGWEVVAFDTSEEAKKKADRLAEKNNVKIEYKISAIETFEYDENSFDVIALIFVHTENREENHRKLIRYLKPGAKIIFEGFSKKQIENNTGGPKNLSMLFSEDELKHDFDVLQNLTIISTETVLNEGQLHTGEASVIRLQGIK